jgi:hypothetical protein
MGAYAAVALQDFFADVPGIGSQSPFLNTPIGAEGDATFRDLDITPTTEIPAVCSYRKALTVNPAAGHGPGGTHGSIMQLFLS